MKFFELLKVTWIPAIEWIKANPWGYVIANLEVLAFAGAIGFIAWKLEERKTKKEAFNQGYQAGKES